MTTDLTARAPLATPAALLQVPRYVTHDGAPPCDVELSDSTNQWGAAPAAVRALAAMAARANGYPTLYGERLKAALAARHGLASECIVTGCGSDNVLGSTIGAFAVPGAPLAYSAPTFAMIPTFARLARMVPTPVPFTESWDVDADALLATEAPIIYLCAPNNPTATPVAAATLARVVAEAPGLVIVDEAYAEYSGVSVIAEAAGHGRLLVARTFSKAWGLAGLRAGWGVAAPELVHAVERVRGPYTLSAAAEAATVAAVTEDGPWVEAHVREALETRRRLERELVALGFAPLPSAANFLCVPVADARAAAARCAAAGVAVRAFPGLPRVGDALRVAVAPWPQLERFLAAIQPLAPEGAR